MHSSHAPTSHRCENQRPESHSSQQSPEEQPALSGRCGMGRPLKGTCVGLQHATSTTRKHLQTDVEPPTSLNSRTTDVETASHVTTTVVNTRNHPQRRNSTSNQRHPGRTNVRRRINWRRQWMACQSTLVLQTDKGTGGATNAEPKADGQPLTTPRNMIQTALSARNRTKRRSSFMDKSTSEKDQPHNATSGLPKSDHRHANQGTISDRNHANHENSLGEDSTMWIHGSSNANVVSTN